MQDERQGSGQVTAVSCKGGGGVIGEGSVSGCRADEDIMHTDRQGQQHRRIMQGTNSCERGGRWKTVRI